MGGEKRKLGAGVWRGSGGGGQGPGNRGTARAALTPRPTPAPLPREVSHLSGPAAHSRGLSSGAVRPLGWGSGRHPERPLAPRLSLGPHQPRSGPTPSLGISSEPEDVSVGPESLRNLEIRTSPKEPLAAFSAGTGGCIALIHFPILPDTYRMFPVSLWDCKRPEF